MLHCRIRYSIGDTGDWCHTNVFFESSLDLRYMLSSNPSLRPRIGLEGRDHMKVSKDRVCSQLATIYYVTIHKTIHMYYLNKSHDSLISHVTKRTH